MRLKCVLSALCNLQLKNEGTHPLSFILQIKSAVWKRQTPNSGLCVRTAIREWRVRFYLTELTEHQLQLTCFEKPKLPYPLRSYVLTQHWQPVVGIDDDTWPPQKTNCKAGHLSQLAHTQVCKQSDIIRAVQETWLTTTDLVACDVWYKQTISC